MTQLITLLERTEQLFHSVRASILEAAAALYEVHQQGAWKNTYDTWGDYINTLGISQGQASKLLKSYGHFVVHGGLSHAKLETVDLEKAYLAIDLTGTPDEQLEKATLLTRSEIRAQRTFEETGNEHDCEPLTICKLCHKRLV